MDERLTLLEERTNVQRKDIDGLHARVHVAEDDVIRLKVNDDIMMPMVRDHQKILVQGDGDKPSLVDSVRTLNNYMQGAQFWLRSIALIFVTQFIAFTVAGVIFFIRVVPVLQKLANP